MIDFVDESQADDNLLDRIVEELSKIPVSQRTKKQSDRHDHARRALTKYEQRVDFAHAKSVLDKSEADIRARLQDELKKVESSTLAWVNANGDKLTSDAVASFEISAHDEVHQTLKDMFENAWNDGRDAGVGEVPPKIRKEPAVENVKTFTVGEWWFKPPWVDNLDVLDIWIDRVNFANAFEPTLAIESFDNRAWLIDDVIDSALQSQIRYELFEHLKGGRTLAETIDNIRQIFEPWIGDPTKLAPGSEDLLSAFRIENIVRTESTWAYNQGRLAVADAAGDYIIGFQFSAIIDDRTTETCRKADGLVLRKDAATTIKLTPPLHYQCRSVLVYVTQADVPVEWSSGGEINAALELIPRGFK